MMKNFQVMKDGFTPQKCMILVEQGHSVSKMLAGEEQIEILSGKMWQNWSDCPSYNKWLFHMLRVQMHDPVCDE